MKKMLRALAALAVLTASSAAFATFGRGNGYPECRGHQFYAQYCD